MSELTAFLPSLPAAREAGLDLPPGDPAEQHRLAALIVSVRLVRREATDNEIESAEPATSLGLLATAPPAPADFVAQSYTSLLEDLGFRPCSACRRQASSPSWCLCKGRGTVHRLRVRQWSDTPIFHHETYVPSQLAFVPEMFSFEGHLERTLAGAAPPECLRCHDLRSQRGGSAYRGGGREQRPDFHGHDFGDGLDKATAAVNNVLKGTLVLHDIRAYAWPFLWLRWTMPEPREIALYARADGGLRAYVGVRPE